MAKIKKTGRHTGAIKSARQAVRHMLRNRAVKQNIRTLAKSYVSAAAHKDAATLQKLMPEVASAWDKAAKTGAIHWKAAARKKSRLARLSHRALAAPISSASAKSST